MPLMRHLVCCLWCVRQKLSTPVLVDLTLSGQPSGFLLDISGVGVNNSGNHGHAARVPQAAAATATSVAVRDTTGC